MFSENTYSGALSNIMLFIVAGTLALLSFRWLSRGTMTRHQFGLHGASLWRSILIGSIVGLAFWGVSELVEMSSSQLSEASEEVMSEFSLGKDLMKDLLVVLGICLFAPVAEEIVFRGAIFNPILQGLKKHEALPKRLPLLIALAISGYAFISAHGGGGQDAQMGLLMLLAVTTALCMYFTGSLITAIYVHAVNNTVVFIYSTSQLSDLPSGHAMTLIIAAIVCLCLCLPVALTFSRLLPAGDDE